MHNIPLKTNQHFQEDRLRPLLDFFLTLLLGHSNKHSVNSPLFKTLKIMN